mmetsp:Transcript_47592/g.152958  ORF Transcript_47592/g.152958 Transcript_47592/m.152958 type:complete len:451 (-) Transcript_47592:235-1587(-)
MEAPAPRLTFSDLPPKVLSQCTEHSLWSKMTEETVDLDAPALPADEVAGSAAPAADGVVVDVGDSDPKTPRSRVSRRAVAKSKSMLSTHLNDFLSEAAQGFEPIWFVCSRLVRHHYRLLLCCLLLIAIGVAGGMAIEGWDFLTSLYVIVQISTTIGYGDVTVDDQLMQLFMSFYVLAILFVVANFLNILLQEIIQRHHRFLHKRLIEFEVMVHSGTENHRDAMKRFRKFNEVIASGSLFLFFIIVGTVFYRLAESCTCSYGTSRHDYGLTQCNSESTETCLATGGLQKTWISALYMSVITVTTIGFGDYTPKSMGGRIFGVVWMLVSVPATAFFISAVSKVVGQGDPADAERDSKPRRFASNARLPSMESLASVDRTVFNVMDRSGTGRLTKAEYTRYVLVNRGFLPLDVLTEIDRKFDCIDFTGSGSITFDMIEAASGYKREAVEASQS